MRSLLQLDKTTIRFGGLTAVSELDLAIGPNELVGLIGPNGAGKSTLVNLLSGFDLPDGGEVTLEGRDITRWSPNRRGHHGLARTFQHSHGFRTLSVRTSPRGTTLWRRSSSRSMEPTEIRGLREE